MTAEVDQLRQEIADLAGRFVADHALLRQALMVGSTPYLRATHLMVERLAEDPSVQAQFRALPFASRKGFEERRRAWQSALEAELAARQNASPIV